MKQKVSLVLSGGGARGIAHIGVIEELEKRDYEIISVTGTSMGALVGGIYALGKLEELKNWLFTLDKRKVFKLVDFTLSSHGLIKGDRVFNKMKEFISDDNIENLRIPFAAVAADIFKKEEVLFTKGSVFEAIRASVSIPMVLTPVKKDNTLLVDGGVLNNIPVKYAHREENDILIAVNVNADIPVLLKVVSKKEQKKRDIVYKKKMIELRNHVKKVLPHRKEEKLGYFNLMDKTLTLMTFKLAQAALQSNPPDILIEVSGQSCGTYDFYKAEEIYDIGRLAAKKSLHK